MSYEDAMELMGEYREALDRYWLSKGQSIEARLERARVVVAEKVLLEALMGQKQANNS